MPYKDEKSQKDYQKAYRKKHMEKRKETYIMTEFKAIKKVIPHPTAAVFKKYGIKKVDVAATIGASAPHLTNILNGKCIPRTPIDTKLRNLAAEIEKEAAEQSGKGGAS